MTYEGSRSTITPGPPSYSPASQRSRYSQPNLPTLMIPDRRIRMSQPTLHSTSLSKLSYSSLRTSGETKINNNNITTTTSNIRTRLSQPTLVTGDYYPPRMLHQRLSQPCLLTTWNEKPITTLRSPNKQNKRFGSVVNQRERIHQLDFGATRFRHHTKELLSVKFNRDRFSIPELETKNDLKLIAGKPKQRYSLDSQLNPESSRTRRLLPIASSPISEQVSIGTKEIGLENIIVATATPLMPTEERHFFAPIVKTISPPPISTRERMSVPEIRNSSLRRLLDPPMKQRHSITGNLLRQPILTAGGDTVEELERTDEEEEEESEIKHIQRHYSYTYDTKDEKNEIIGKLSVTLPKKKYLESNFNENEQVITTVIETEIPMILSSPKYMKKTHVYGSEAPKWMKKCLESKHNSKKMAKLSPKSNKNKSTCVRIKSGNPEVKYEVKVNTEWSDSASEDSTSV